MSTMTQEQVESLATDLRDAPSTSMLGTHISLPTAKIAEIYNALCDYAAHLREREAAKSGVTDEMVEYASRIYSDSSPFALQAMRAALEAVAPMLASARVPDGWQPTPANINALPLPIRKYIMMLETEADPAGTIRQNVLVSEENDMLRAALTEALAAAPKHGEG